MKERVFLLCMIFMMAGVVSAANVALDAEVQDIDSVHLTAAYKDFTTVNDGDYDSFVQAAQRGDGAYSRVNVNLTFDSAVNLTEIVYSRFIKNGGSSSGRACRENASVTYSNGTTQEIYLRKWNGVSFSNTLNVSIPGDFKEVVGISVRIAASIGGHTSENKIRLYEVEAFTVPECGDGYSEGEEECDDGNDINEDSCLSNCTLNTCGDGYLNEGVEECDDGNLGEGDGCSSSCALESYGGEYYCGDGIVFNNSDFSEECDNGTDNGLYYCTLECKEDEHGGREFMAYWADMDGNEVNESNLFSSVSLVAGQFLEGEEVTFEIYENDPDLLFFSLDDSIVVGSDAIVAIADSEGIARAIWTISEEDYDASVDHGDYYFIASSNGEEAFSDSLEISSERVEAPFAIDLISPDCGSDYSVGDTLEVVINASDPDDLIEGNLTIDDELVGYFGNGVATLYYNFSLAGVYYVQASATNGQFYRFRNSNLIVVDPAVDSSYVAACIDEPKESVMISDGRDIFFNASSTRAVKNVAGTGLTDLDKSCLDFYWSVWLNNEEVDSSSWPTSGSNPLSHQFYLSLPPGRASAGLSVSLDEAC